MALLSIKKRKEFFKKIGLGDYTASSILILQKRYFPRKKDHDGIYGKDTDILLRHVVNCFDVPDFIPEEFCCECGGMYCTGYPTWIRYKTVSFMQKIRNYVGRPVYITSGLRCKKQNQIDGGISSSKHMTGTAVDYFIPNMTFNLKDRKDLINIIKKWDNHDYSYCNGYDSNGDNRIAKTMGTSIHTQTK